MVICDAKIGSAEGVGKIETRGRARRAGFQERLWCRWACRPR